MNAFNSVQFKLCEELRFAHITIKDIQAGAFNGLRYLRILRMDFIELYDFHEHSLAPMPYLHIFRLTDCGNQLLNINRLFANVTLKYLNTLMINRCNLKDTITEQTFSGLFRLKKLILSFNQIERIAPKAFDDCINSLTLLALDSNKLTNIPSDLFKMNDKNVYVFIHLHDNLFHCDCNLDYLRIAAQTFVNIVFTNMICVTPSKYVGLSLRECLASFCSETQIQIDETNKQHANEKLLEYSNVSSDAIPKPIKPMLNAQMPVNLRDSNQIGNSSTILVSPKNTFKVRCKMEKSTRNSLFRDEVTLRNKTRFHVRIDKGQLLISADVINFNLKFIEFISNGHDKNENCFTNVRRTHAKSLKKFQIRQKLQSNHLHRFCWIDKRSKSITALDCTAFYTLALEATLEPWIFVNEKGKSISIIGMIMVLAVTVGGLVAVLLRFKYPKLIINTKKQNEREEGTVQIQEKLSNVVDSPIGESI